jgi:hypothetical protein
MSAGVRIQHPTERNCVFTLVDASRPYRDPFFCMACGGKTHTFKTYHIRLDESGAAIVSQEIAERLKRLPVQPFTVANEVVAPPPQTLRPGAPLELVPIVASPELREPV